MNIYIKIISKLLYILLYNTLENKEKFALVVTKNVELYIYEIRKRMINKRIYNIHIYIDVEKMYINAFDPIVFDGSMIST